MLHYCYKHYYIAEKDGEGDIEWISRAHIHAELYTLGEKYDLQALKKVTQSNFANFLRNLDGPNPIWKVPKEI